MTTSECSKIYRIFLAFFCCTGSIINKLEPLMDSQYKKQRPFAIVGNNQTKISFYSLRLSQPVRDTIGENIWKYLT